MATKSILIAGGIAKGIRIGGGGEERRKEKLFLTDTSC